MKPLLFAGFFCVVGGIVAGMEIGFRQRDAMPDKVVTLTKACPVRAEGYHILACTMGESDYRNICRARWKSAGRNP
jgi:hypothetical protein